MSDGEAGERLRRVAPFFVAGLGGLMLAAGVRDLYTGEAHQRRRGGPPAMVRRDTQPGAYWESVAGNLVGGALLGAVGLVLAWLPRRP